MTNEGPLAGKTALVTGGSRGIGAEIVRRLASDGADIAFTYHTSRAEADEVAASVRGLGRAAVTIHADFADATAPAAATKAARSGLGRLDILVNNAGVTFWRPIAQMDAESFDRIVAVNVRAPFLLIKETADAISDGGRIINITSGVTSSAVPGSSLYSGTKAFIDQLTKVAALEFAARRITVNAIGPGSTATGPLADLPADRLAEMGAAAFLLGRLATPADTAALVAFLASNQASFITGQVIYNTGGQHGPIGRTRPDHT
jgi:3-oxoacyl-[acyl-carrier protein] reductase